MVSIYSVYEQLGTTTGGIILVRLYFVMYIVGADISVIGNWMMLGICNQSNDLIPAQQPTQAIERYYHRCIGTTQKFPQEQL